MVAPLFHIVPSEAVGSQERVAASERITFGMIGTGDHGIGLNLRATLGRADTQVVAVCDVDGSRMRKAYEMVTQWYAANKPSDTFRGCDQTKDFRDVVSRSDIDAVVISTPDHWHVPCAVAAAKNGKDVLCEKPLTLTVAEGRILSDTMKRYGRVLRVATEMRANSRLRKAAELVRNGRIGKLHTIRVRLPNGAGGKAVTPATPPKDLDWNMWLGPAPWREYFYFRTEERRCHFSWRYIMDYSGGQLTDWGGHLFDSAQWGNNTERSGPISVEGRGEFATRGLANTASEFELTYEYANGVKLICTSGGTEVRYEGTDGWVSSGKPYASSREIAESVIGPDDIQLKGSRELGDFINSVKTREESQIPAEVGHRTCTLSHIGNIAMLLERKLRWDPQAERFISDVTANRMLSRAQREPWGL